MTSPHESTDTELKQEEFDPYRLDERPIPPQNFRLVKPALFSRLPRWPALVVFGQLKPCHCPQLSGQTITHLVTFVATLISTFLAGSSSFLFSYALRRSMSLYLYRSQH
ncbi:hypothetical protein DFH06DRAFT_1484837 [Mycena polygramma]|nr:hypothetical protein DFH06DRAFT_1484837 [Mycena polygramma]